MISAIRCEYPEHLTASIHFNVMFLFCLHLSFPSLLLLLPSVVTIKSFMHYFLQPHTDPPAPGAESDPDPPELAVSMDPMLSLAQVTPLQQDR